MFLAHLPAGYAASVLLYRRLARPGQHERAFVIAGSLGGLAPDVDMFWFYLVDHRQHHHHSYVTHWPVVWGAVLLLAFLWWRWQRKSNAAAVALIVGLNGFIHLILDTIVGDIWWLMPFVNEPFAFFTVVRQVEPWWLNFLLHWSALLEVLVIAFAVRLWLRRRRASPAQGL